MSSFLAGAEMIDLLGAALEVQRRLLAVGEAAGRLEHQIDAQVLPRELRRILLGKHLHRVAVHGQTAVVGADLAGEATVDGVVLE